MGVGTKDSDASGLLIWVIAAVLLMTVMLSMLAGMVMDVDILDSIMTHVTDKSL